MNVIFVAKKNLRVCHDQTSEHLREISVFLDVKQGALGDLSDDGVHQQILVVRWCVCTGLRQFGF